MNIDHSTKNKKHWKRSMVTALPGREATMLNLMKYPSSHALDATCREKKNIVSYIKWISSRNKDVSISDIYSSWTKTKYINHMHKGKKEKVEKHVYTNKCFSCAYIGMKTWGCWRIMHKLHAWGLLIESCRGEDWRFWGDCWGGIHLLHVWDLLVEPK